VFLVLAILPTSGKTAYQRPRPTLVVTEIDTKSSSSQASYQPVERWLNIYGRTKNGDNFFTKMPESNPNSRDKVDESES